ADCVAVGSGTGRANAEGLPPGTTLRTTNGGRMWAPGILPSGMFFVPFSVGSVTCAGTSTCYALGLRLERYQTSPSAHLSAPGTINHHICAPPPPTPPPY